jgi:hypothetical protein
MASETVILTANAKDLSAGGRPSGGRVLAV